MWLADDDLVMSTADLNTFLAVMAHYGLLAAQPALCQSSLAHFAVLLQAPGTRLRYTDFVEIMGPALEISFFQHVVRHTLHNTHIGFALDFLWPALLHHHNGSVAVVDEVCMVSTWRQGYLSTWQSGGRAQGGGAWGQRGQGGNGSSRLGWRSELCRQPQHLCIMHWGATAVSRRRGQVIGPALCVGPRKPTSDSLNPPSPPFPVP